MHRQLSPLGYADGNPVTIERTRARWKPQALLALILLLVNSTFAQKEIVLHTFSDFTTGETPVGVIFDRAGNIVGATSWGGIQNCSPEPGCGTIFELVKTSKGWRHKLLYTFQGGLDGDNPQGELVLDRAGNLYGTTVWGGPVGGGTVFELSPSKDGWTESIIHSFGEDHDGGNPSGGLTLGADGSMYGSALWGGAHGAGAIYKLTHSKTGWDESIIYSFGANNQDGAGPQGQPIFDSHGDLYGATNWGGQR